MRVLGIIPARGGSVRIPRKNLQKVGSMTLLHHAMVAAKRSLRLTDWRVSTDDVDIALAAIFVDGNVMRILSRHSSAGDGPTVRVLQEAVTDLKRGQFDAVCTIQPTSPLRTWEDIDATVELLIKHPAAMSAVSVDAATGKRNGAVYVTRLPMLLDGKVYDEESLKYVMPHNRSIDINTPEDLAEARRMAK
jgi:CMP-N,N'-diacetyllegionaminic acid synthase